MSDKVIVVGGMNKYGGSDPHSDFGEGNPNELLTRLPVESNYGFDYSCDRACTK
jgi:hypothetical protein